MRQRNYIEMQRRIVHLLSVKMKLKTKREVKEFLKIKFRNQVEDKEKVE